MCFSIYSDISSLIIAFSSPNITSASDLQSSVLPTPVGPRKINEPTGRLGSFRPTLPLLIALLIAETASSWPITLLWRISSIFSNLSDSSWVNCTTGTPVQSETIFAISSAVTSPPCWLSLCHFSFSVFNFSSSDFCSSLSFAAFSKFWDATAASFSFSSSLILSSIDLTSVGIVIPSSLTLEADSSIRSIALSGRKRSAIYLEDSFTAASIASSVIFTLWWASYLSLKPLRICIASSSLGSPTLTGWNLLSRAASFSMYFLYSLIVVAPKTWKSPLAREGFRILAASVEPSAEPAPIIVWSSSINRITLLVFFTSSMIPLILSSKSPLYFAPAIIELRSRAIILLSFRISGTSPLAIFRARPSATAVLPTPGSPIRTGLFFVLRQRICTTLWISSVLPITGSISPFLAASVKSLP